jgi:hypothetical protein
MPNGTNGLTVLSGGNVGIGTTSPSALFHVNTSGNDPVLISNTGANSYNSLILSNNNNYKVAIGIGGGSVGGNLQDNGFIGTISNRDFLINTNNTERMRITSTGNVGIGTTSPSYTFSVLSSNNVVWLQDTSLASDATFVLFSVTGATNIGNISRIGTTNAVAYNTVSDYRLKEDLKEINGLEKLSKIKVYDFKWKDNESRMDGVIAHELQEVVPYAVTGEKDAEQMQSVDYSKLVPILVQAIQELKAEIEILKN